MGYHTNFAGRFDLSRTLTQPEAKYLEAFSASRRVRRDSGKVAFLPDSVREAVGLPIGKDGSFFVGGGTYGDASVIDVNTPPTGQPGLWCDWVPTEDGAGIEWNQCEKFYAYEAWLNYIIDHFLTPWGIGISGRVRFQGEQTGDSGYLEIQNGRCVMIGGTE